MGLPFEQQPQESAKAFAAFSEYLNQGSERSLDAVGQKCGKSSRLIQRWSSRWRWGERVQAHAAHLATVERLAVEATARGKSAEWLARQVEQRDAEWQSRNDALDLARESIARWMKNKKRCGSLEGIARLLDLASTLGRRASGLPMERTEVTGPDGGPIRVEFDVALKKIYGQAAGATVEVEVVEAPKALPADASGPPLAGGTP